MTIINVIGTIALLFGCVLGIIMFISVTNGGGTMLQPRGSDPHAINTDPDDPTLMQPAHLQLSCLDEKGHTFQNIELEPLGEGEYVLLSRNRFASSARKAACDPRCKQVIEVPHTLESDTVGSVHAAIVLQNGSYYFTEFARSPSRNGSWLVDDADKTKKFRINSAALSDILGKCILLGTFPVSIEEIVEDKTRLIAKKSDDKPIL